jgi:hypothetical protein
MNFLQATEIMKFWRHGLATRCRRIRDDSRSMVRGGDVVAAPSYDSQAAAISS